MAIESLLIHKRPENVKRKHTGKEKKVLARQEKEKKRTKRKNTVPAMSGIVSEESSHLYIVVFPFLAGCSAHLFSFPLQSKKRKKERQELMMDRKRDFVTFDFIKELEEIQRLFFQHFPRCSILRYFT
jgi:hypothetical protein